MNKSLRHLLNPSKSIAALRMVCGAIFILHAAARIYNNTLGGFGDFLQEQGFPAGYILAWLVTGFELVGGILMFFRIGVKLFCVLETLILITGIITVHWKYGWFVVGQTMGGMEYSVVLISILIAIFFAERKHERNIRPVL